MRAPLILAVATLASSSTAALAQAANEAPEAPGEAACPTRQPKGLPPLGPKPAHLLSGDAAQHGLIHLDLGKCMTLEIPAGLAGRAEYASSFPVDRYGNEYQPGLSLAPELRIGARFDTARALKSVNLMLELEHDVVTGVKADPRMTGPVADAAGEADVPAKDHTVLAPYTHGLEMQPRKAYGRVAIGKAAQVTGGLMTSHWGLGLLANDGAHGWTPGSARFTDPRSGDRVLRVMLSTGPHSDAGLTAAAGYDFASWDDASYPDDKAQQFFFALVGGYGKTTTAGAYVVWRHQEAPDGKTTDVNVVDVMGQTLIDLDSARVTLGTEMALITGTTQLGPSPDFEEHDIMQFGAAFQAGLDLGELGANLDFLYASGDQNLDDGTQHGFRADVNYHMGILLFRHVLAAQSARGAVTAADTTLVGVPAEDLDRIPTQGRIGNTIAIFPRIRYRPIDGLEAYAGPLFAFAAASNLDPFNTRLGGGAPHNSLNAPGGSYLGTEYDLGVRYRAQISGALLDVGAEGGILQPGDALSREDGSSMGSVYGGRVLVGFHL